MRVLDLFSGTGSASAAFYRAGHLVMAVDINRNLADPTARQYTYNGDILEIAQDARAWIDQRSPGFRPNFIWLSPPCQAFSLGASRAGHWTNVGV